MTDKKQNTENQPIKQASKSLLHLLTPEEHAQLQEEGKDALLKALEQGHMIAEAWLASWRNPAQEESQIAQQQAQEIHQSIMSAPPEQTSLFQWCGFPTDMTRVSPFHPMALQELG